MMAPNYRSAKTLENDAPIWRTRRLFEEELFYERKGRILRELAVGNLINCL